MPASVPRKFALQGLWCSATLRRFSKDVRSVYRKGPRARNSCAARKHWAILKARNCCEGVAPLVHPVLIVPAVNIHSLLSSEIPNVKFRVVCGPFRSGLKTYAKATKLVGRGGMLWSAANNCDHPAVTLYNNRKYDFVARILER